MRLQSLAITVSLVAAPAAFAIVEAQPSAPTSAATSILRSLPPAQQSVVKDRAKNLYRHPSGAWVDVNNFVGFYSAMNTATLWNRPKQKDKYGTVHSLLKTDEWLAYQSLQVFAQGYWEGKEQECSYVDSATVKRTAVSSFDQWMLAGLRLRVKDGQRSHSEMVKVGLVPLPATMHKSVQESPLSGVYILAFDTQERLHDTSDEVRVRSNAMYCRINPAYMAGDSLKPAVDYVIFATDETEVIDGKSRSVHLLCEAEPFRVPAEELARAIKAGEFALTEWSWTKTKEGRLNWSTKALKLDFKP